MKLFQFIIYLLMTENFVSELTEETRENIKIAAEKGKNIKFIGFYEMNLIFGSERLL